MKWISVDERLPESYEIVIVAIEKSGVWPAVLADGEWHDPQMTWNPLKNVTHWQPLPPPPDTAQDAAGSG